MCFTTPWGSMRNRPLEERRRTTINIDMDQIYRHFLCHFDIDKVMSVKNIWKKHFYRNIFMFSFRPLLEL
jgi:hypothetical protein